MAKYINILIVQTKNEYLPMKKRKKAKKKRKNHHIHRSYPFTFLCTLVSDLSRPFSVKMASQIENVEQLLDKYIPPEELAAVKRLLYGKELRYITIFNNKCVSYDVLYEGAFCFT